jgi:lathosterol oxidase
MKYFLIYILYYDFFYYFLHRLFHTKYLYPIHKIHHSYKKLQYSNYLQIHYLEYLLSNIGLYIALYLYGLYIYQFLITICFINVRGLMEHDERFIFIVGNHHLQHHCYIFCNYGEYWIDYVFGTVYKNKIINNKIN